VRGVSKKQEEGKKGRKKEKSDEGVG